MPTAVFGPVSANHHSWQATLGSPDEIKQANTLEEVISVLEFAETAARRGSYVALLLSYEAAPAFDSALVAHPPASFPLAWAASFSASAVVESPSGDYNVGDWIPQIDRDQYAAAVHRIHELIAAGDTYQVNYTFPLKTAFAGDAQSWYQELSSAHRVPFSVYLDLGEFKVLSMSPELFFERRGNKVTTRPMKGTAARGRTKLEDLAQTEWLKNSTKDRAENVMIVDLLRNDLGKVSEPGTVEVTSLFEVEKYETVLQMTSTVSSTLRPNTSLVELMSALFPCGSITGAPKIRTTEIIHELEPFPRGSYTGTIGLLQPGGDCIFNVAIRTIVVDAKGTATFGVGGGITIDSTPELEYEECLVKSRFLRERPRDFKLFESILLENGEYFLLDRHLQRLRDSADYFGFSTAETQRALSIRPGTWKVRLTLSQDGSIETDWTEIELDQRIRRVALASKPIDSADRFLYHKTTRREFHEHPGIDDLVFWNERGEVTESTIANVVIERDGRMITPPVMSGLLAGTFRDELIATGKLEEQVISIEDLRTASQFYLINSVRKWMPATLISHG
jgi:para-aminobenzoate synthetase/4-amino-4-deoxychorismate lyase